MGSQVREAALKVLAGVLAGLVIGIGVFQRSARYALVVGLVVGVGYAVASAARDRIERP